MTEEHVPAQATREEAKHYILLTLDRFRVMTLHLADNKSRLPSALNGNEGGLDLLYELEARDFYRNLMFLYTSDIFEVLSNEGLRELLLKCKELSERFCLKVRIPADIRVVEDPPTRELPLSQTEDADKESLWDSFLGVLQGEFNEERNINGSLQEINYFLTKYKDLSNWEYTGQGYFIAKKSATLWELGGVYWNKLFELPENPDVIQIGDRVRLRPEVLNKIYEYAVTDVKGNYMFTPKSPEAVDLICGVIGFWLGTMEDVPKIIELGNYTNDAYSIYEVFSTKEETSPRLSFFIQQYSTEGQEEDAWKKILTIGGLLGSIFGFLELLSSASIEQNKYQIVQYNQRKAFLNSAKYEIQRIEKLKKSIKEKELQIEIQYLRFLEKQIKLLKNEIQLNNERERQQRAEILYSFSQYNTRGVTYKDTRIDASSSSYHKIDYYQIFKETL